MLTANETVVINQCAAVWESCKELRLEDSDKAVIFDGLRRINDIVMATAVRQRGIPDEVKPPTAPEPENPFAVVKRANLAKIGARETPSKAKALPLQTPLAEPSSQATPAPENSTSGASPSSTGA